MLLLFVIVRAAAVVVVRLVCPFVSNCFHVSSERHYATPHWINAINKKLIHIASIAFDIIMFVIIK